MKIEFTFNNGAQLGLETAMNKNFNILRHSMQTLLMSRLRDVRYRTSGESIVLTVDLASPSWQVSRCMYDCISDEVYGYIVLTCPRCLLGSERSNSDATSEECDITPICPSLFGVRV